MKKAGMLILRILVTLLVVFVCELAFVKFNIQELSILQVILATAIIDGCMFFFEFRKDKKDKSEK